VGLLTGVAVVVRSNGVWRWLRVWFYVTGVCRHGNTHTHTQSTCSSLSLTGIHVQHNQQISDFSTVAWVIKNSVRVHWRKNRNDADRRNRKVISRCENKSTDDAETTLSGSAFQILIPATGKARLPKGDSLKDGTTRKLVVVDRSVRRPNTWTRRMSK